MALEGQNISLNPNGPCPFYKAPCPKDSKKCKFWIELDGEIPGQPGKAKINLCQFDGQQILVQQSYKALVQIMAALRIIPTL